MKAFLCVVLGAVAWVSLASSAVAGPPYKPSQCPDPYAATPACYWLHSEAGQPKPPAVPIAGSKVVAKAAFSNDYNTIWTFISPQYQSAVSHPHWLSCQKKNPVAPPGVRLDRIVVAGSEDIPMRLPQLGAQTVFEVQMQVFYTRQGSQGLALVNVYWFHNGQNKWGIVWLPSIYAKYKSGGCDVAGPTRGLY
jgi:hypothetical protein